MLKLSTQCKVIAAEIAANDFISYAHVLDLHPDCRCGGDEIMTWFEIDEWPNDQSAEEKTLFSLFVAQALASEGK